MRKEKTLVVVLRRLADLLAEESRRNPEFASKLEEVLSGIPESRPSKARSKPRSVTEPQIDVHSEWKARGESEFRIWLRDQPLATIRAVIRAQDLDPTRRTAKWKDAEKLADYVTDSLRARASRGSAFIGNTRAGRSGE